jgi:3-hydroxyisobutyrate dehydrogenase and related beta-hydroxyacid dehydrogenases
MGAMGSRMATSLIAAGYSVTVWNIEASACLPIVKLGARQAATPAEAVTHAEFVITMVWDDAASADVWLDPQTGALPNMQVGSIALECATLTLGHEKNWPMLARLGVLNSSLRPCPGLCPRLTIVR